ncbi:MAG: hypothetical protein ACE5R6_21160, partial [Candidatus Heimdallarchaeota archaeon]
AMLTLISLVVFLGGESITHVAQGAEVEDVITRNAPRSFGTSLATAEGAMEWNQTYGGSDRDEAFSAGIQTADGGFVFVGSTGTNAWQVSNAWQVKTDVHGVLQWERSWDELYYHYSFSAGIQTADGGFALAGTRNTVLGEQNTPCGWLVKTNAHGVLQWERSFCGYTSSGNSGGRFNDIIQTADGGFALVGEKINWTHTEGPEPGYMWYGYYTRDLWLVKTDANGFVEWTQIFGGRGWDDEAHAVIQMADGGFILVGSLNGNAWAVKTGPRGGYKWSFTYGPGVFTSIIKTVDGNFLLAGNMDWDVKLLKINARGEHLWARNYGGRYENGVSAIIQTADGGFAFIGYTYSFGAGGSDAWLVKTTADGDVEWNLTFGGKKGDGASAIIEMADGSFVLVGYTCSFGAGGSDAWLVKTTSPEITPPGLSAPEDITFEKGMAGHVITWAAGDRHPGNYVIYINSGQVASGSWTNGTIPWDLDGLAPGSYNVTLVVRDLFNNRASDTVWVTVFAAAAPELSTTEDIAYEEETTGYVINWTVGDRYPGIYAIYLNSKKMDTGSWVNGTIPWNVDGLTEGTYNVTLVVWDAAGNRVSDTVWVTVTVPTTPPLPELRGTRTLVLLSLSFVALVIINVRKKL